MVFLEELLRRLLFGAAKSPIDMTTTAAIDAPPEENFGDDATVILELVLWHQMSTISAHELVHLGDAINAVTAWISDHIRLLSAARRKDDTTDWYFPLHFRKSVEQTAVADDDRSSLSWCGIHHSSGEIHHLFPLAHLPPAWIPNMSPCHDIIASSGGLLLITYTYRMRQFREPRGVRQPTNNRIFPLPTATSQNWKPLLVSNPLTREWRVLPAPDCRDVGVTFREGVTSWEYDGSRALMVVDDEANTYKLVFISRNYVLLYKSTCDSWACRAFPQPRPWGSLGVDYASYVGASACVGGRLYFADMEVRGMILPIYSDDVDIRRLGCVRVFELAEEAGTWKPPIRYPLQNFFLHNPERDHGFRIGSYAFEMVECMGSMFAVIPAEVDMLATVEEMRRAYGDDELRKFCKGFMPLQFHILKLQGEAGLAQGILCIHILENFPIFWGQRMRSLYERLTWNPHMEMFHNASWFRCTARGSVIWVTFDDYVLQYDVVSGQSKTRILPDTSFADAPDLSYKPSFHMKP